MSDLTGNTLNNVELLNTLADLIDKLNNRIKSQDIEDTAYASLISIISQAKDLYKELKEITLYTDVLLVEDLENQVNILISDINSKLDSGFFIDTEAVASAKDYTDDNVAILDKKIDDSVTSINSNIDIKNIEAVTTAKTYTNEQVTTLNNTITTLDTKTTNDMTALQTLLTSDDSTLDTIQEVVNYIKQNRNDLSSLGIANVSGLSEELDKKQNLIIDTGWQDLTPYLVNGWVPYDQNLHPVSYRKIGDIVFFRGIIKDGSSFTIFENLPAFLIPLFNFYISPVSLASAQDRSYSYISKSGNFITAQIEKVWTSIVCTYLVN